MHCLSWLPSHAGQHTMQPGMPQALGAPKALLTTATCNISEQTRISKTACGKLHTGDYTRSCSSTTCSCESRCMRILHDACSGARRNRLRCAEPHARHQGPRNSGHTVIRAAHKPLTCSRTAQSLSSQGRTAVSTSTLASKHKQVTGQQCCPEHAPGLTGTVPVAFKF
jgi:hypothetical protein